MSILAGVPHRVETIVGKVVGISLVCMVMSVDPLQILVALLFGSIIGSMFVANIIR